MPYLMVRVEPKLFMEHNGVKVYHAYSAPEKGDPEIMPDYFTLHPEDDDWTHPLAFDATDLEVPSGDKLWTEIPPTTAHLMRQTGLPMQEFLESPMHHENVLLWEQWHRERRPAILRAIIAEAIDAGIVK